MADTTVRWEGSCLSMMLAASGMVLWQVSERGGGRQPTAPL